MAKGVRRLFGTAAILALILLLPGTAGAARHALPRGFHAEVVSCLTGSPGVAERLGCGTVAGAGERDSALANVTALAVDSSRMSVYATGKRNSSLAQLALGSGRRLAFGACFTGDLFGRSCPALPGASHNAVEAPISWPNAAAVSPDGRSLYVVSGGGFHSSMVARFARDPAGGALAYQGCLTGDLDAGPSSPAACETLPGATSRGYGSGIYEASGVAIAADGRRVYVTGSGDASLTALDRDPASGALSFASCLSSNRTTRACAQIGDGHAPVLGGLGSPWISPDGRYLYAAASRGETVSAFALGGASPLRFAGCISSRDDRRPCRPAGRPEGVAAALESPSGLTGSPDGRFLYAGSRLGRIVALRRNRATGTLSLASCLSSRREDRRRCARTPASPQTNNGSHNVSLLAGARTPLLGAGGRTLLVPVGSLDGLAELRRDPRSGALRYRGCVTGDRRLSTDGDGPCQPLRTRTGNGVDSGLSHLTVLVPGPGRLVYAAAWGDATVSLLRP